MASILKNHKAWIDASNIIILISSILSVKGHSAYTVGGSVLGIVMIFVFNTLQSEESDRRQKKADENIETIKTLLQENNYYYTAEGVRLPTSPTGSYYIEFTPAVSPEGFVMLKSSGGNRHLLATVRIYDLTEEKYYLFLNVHRDEYFTKLSFRDTTKFCIYINVGGREFYQQYMFLPSTDRRDLHLDAFYRVYGIRTNPVTSVKKMLIAFQGNIKSSTQEPRWNGFDTHINLHSKFTTIPT